MSAMDEVVGLKCPPCPWCGRQEEVAVTLGQAVAYSNGASIQEAFPQLNADDREKIKTGICPSCWDTHIRAASEEAWMDGGEG